MSNPLMSNPLITLLNHHSFIHPLMSIRPSLNTQPSLSTLKHQSTHIQRLMCRFHQSTICIRNETPHRRTFH